jgi:TM2 domain-containing membrane protein YozV
MDYRTFEQRLLDTIFTTDVQLNPATIAFLYKLSVQEASDLLQQAAVAGLLNIESDDEGNILYTYPNRVRLGAQKDKPGGAGHETALARARGSALSAPLSEAMNSLMRGDNLQLQSPIQEVASVPSVIDMTEVAGGGPGQPTGLSGYGATANAGAQPAAGAPTGQTMPCPFCSEVILVGAKKCKHCHEYLDFMMRDFQAHKQQVNQLGVALAPVNQNQQAQALVQQQLLQQQQQQLQQWTNTSATQAALLSFFVPGLGQMCSGRVPAGLLWMMFTCLGYVCFIVPGMVLHILCVINAARQPPQLR